MFAVKMDYVTLQGIYTMNYRPALVLIISVIQEIIAKHSVHNH